VWAPLSSAAVTPEVRLFTVADARYFVGAAALVNSVRLAGIPHPVFVVDCGFEPDQRERLSAVATVLTLPPAYRGLHPQWVKATPDLFWSDGVVILLDTDMIVTGGVDYLVERALAGQIGVHPDHEVSTGRQFEDWVSTFRLQGPLRPQTYVNAVPLGISLDRWPGFFERWREACALLPPDWASRGLANYGPGDQDALNAILMSEVDPDDIWVADPRLTVHADGFPEVELAGDDTVRCSFRGVRPTVLHYGMSPKPWRRQAWSRIRPDDAFVRLFPRLVFARDVRVRARLREVPAWLWPWGIGTSAAALVRLLYLAGLLNGMRRTRNAARAPLTRVASWVTAIGGTR
jgi:hypothetical protein